MKYFDFLVRVTVRGETRKGARSTLDAFLDQQHDSPAGVLADSSVEKDVLTGEELP